jgi:hypothetical protein
MTESEAGLGAQLQGTLRDARLERIASSRSARSLIFTIHSPHLNKFHQLPVETRFHLHCADAVWARFGASVPWPGNPFAAPAEPSSQQTPDWSVNWSAEWAGASVSWEDCEQSLAAEPWGPSWIFQAELESLGPNDSALRLGLQANEEDWPGLYVRMAQLHITANDGRSWSLREFIDLGEDYWEDFAERRQAVREASIPR